MSPAAWKPSMPTTSTRPRKSVTTEMEAMGATKGADGKWQFNGAPVTLIFLIRNDGDGTRLPMGDYFAAQLEALGFTVDRQARKSSELSPLWIGSDPEGRPVESLHGRLGFQRSEPRREDHLPGNVPARPAPRASRCSSTTSLIPPSRSSAMTWRMAIFTTLEAAPRHDRRGPAACHCRIPSRSGLVDPQTYAPFNCELKVSADVGAGVETTQMAPFNLRFKARKVARSSLAPPTPCSPIRGIRSTAPTG